MSTHVPGLTAARVLVCPGIQPTLLSLCSILAPRPQDSIACEAVTYPGLKSIAARLGTRLVGLPCDDDGIDPGAFAALCASDLPRALYVNPTFNNPTTAILSQARREAIVEIARRYSVPIIEDDPYGCLPSRRPEAIAALAPELTFYLTGFAKCLGAGLRVSYVATPNPRYTARVSAAMRTTSVMAAPMMVRLATRWINDGTTGAATLAIREESRVRQQMAREVLRKAQYISKPESFHLWLSLPEPWNRIEFATHLRSHGVAVVVSDSFTIAGPAAEAVRVCLGGPADRKECRHNLELLQDAIEQAPATTFRGM
jgi:DNA-binding transcriptional MocR family regulator